MMNFETKFNIGQHVWLMKNNAPVAIVIVVLAVIWAGSYGMMHVPEGYGLALAISTFAAVISVVYIAIPKSFYD